MSIHALVAEMKHRTWESSDELENEVSRMVAKHPESFSLLQKSFGR